MSCIQAITCRPCNYVLIASRSCRPPSKPNCLPIGANYQIRPFLKLSTNRSMCLPCITVLKHRPCVPVSRYQQGGPVSLLGGKDTPQNDDKASPWKAIEKAMGKQSIEDVLRQQIQKKDYFDEDSGKTPPRGGGGGGGGGDGNGDRDNSQEPEDESLAGIMDETLQVVLATMGFIFLYIYIISGEEINRFAKDYIKYLFGGGKSIRLERFFDQWRRYIARMKYKPEYDPMWLEKAIINTPTRYDSPEKYRAILEPYLRSDKDCEREKSGKKDWGKREDDNENDDDDDEYWRNGEEDDNDEEEE